MFMFRRPQALELISFNHDAELESIITSYLERNDPIQRLSELFRSWYLRYNESQSHLHTSGTDRLKGFVLRMVFASMYITLAEHNKLRPSQEMTRTFCPLSNGYNYCEFLGSWHDDIGKGTHTVLSTIGILREGNFPTVTDADGIIGLDGSEIPLKFRSQAMLALYAIHFSRVTNAMEIASRLRDTKRRYKGEACLFMTILSFYADYVNVSKSKYDDNLRKQWEKVYQQVSLFYLGNNEDPFRYFRVLKVENPDGSGNTAATSGSSELIRAPLKAFLSQDNIDGAQKCITKTFIRPNKALMIRQPRASYDVQPVITCLNGQSLLPYRFARWFRSKLKRALSLARPLALATGGVLGAYAYRQLFAETIPIPHAYDVAVALVGFAGTPAAEFLAKGVAGLGVLAAGKKVGAALVLAFFTPTPAQVPWEEKALAQETAEVAPYLEYEYSPVDGTIRTIYNITTLPPRFANSARNWDTGNLQQYGGDARRTPPKKGGQLVDLRQLQKVMLDGQMRNELPQEMQRFIANKMQMVMKPDQMRRQQRGGAADTEENLERRRIPLKYGGEAEVPAYVETLADGSNYLVMPKTKAEEEALKNSEWVTDTLDPDTDAGNDENALPDLEEDGTPPKTVEEVLREADRDHIPLPSALAAQTVMPPWAGRVPYAVSPDPVHAHVVVASPDPDPVQAVVAFPDPDPAHVVAQLAA